MEQFVELPLYEDEDYYYTVSLEGNAYQFRLYFNMRMQQWIYDLRYVDGDPIVLGEALVPNLPILLEYATPLTGFLWLQPIGKEQNETVINPFELSKYYQLFYIWEE